MTTLTREKIKALREAARKATKGPYFQMGAPWFREGTGVLAGSPDPHVGPVVLETESWAGERDEQVENGAELADPEDDAAFFALLDPATILSLCDMAEAGQTDRVGELVKALNIIDALDPEEHVYGMSHDACRGLIIRMGEIARTALSKAQEDGK